MEVHDKIFDWIVNPPKKVEAECKCYDGSDEAYMIKVDQEKDALELNNHD